MKTIKQFILECDFFAHGSLQRYRQEQSYRTFAGGLISIIFVLLFAVMFSNLIVQTFSKNIIVSQTSTTYDDEPTYTQILASPSHNHMFAIGISGMNLSSSQRYFDIVMTARARIKNGTSTIKISEIIELQPCSISHWSGITQNIENSYTTLDFNQWLCPSINQSIALQGKFTSNIFKFAQITVNTCSNSSLFPNTTCHSTAQLANFLQSKGQFTFNYYFVNPVLNPSDKDPVTYYLEDTNYFAFDTTMGVNANLYYSDYSMQTDTTFLPWQEYQQDAGSMVEASASGQNYQVVNSSTSFLQFNIRKAANNQQITRSFQKLDQTFSYIGGLFGTISLLLSFLKLYSKYTYQLDLGDKIFKQNHGGSFGSQNFNFVVFIGYLFFNLFTKFSVVLNWKTMKKFHTCRMECQKQLNIDLLFKKLNHFEEITKIVLQDFQLKMLLMAPKPTIKEAKINRKRYLIKNLIYHNLQQKAGDVNVQRIELKSRLKLFLRDQGNQNIQQIMGQDAKPQQSLKLIQEEIVQSYKKIKNDAGDSLSSSKKIIQRINIQDMTEMIFGFINAQIQHTIQNHLERTQQYLQTKIVNINQFAQNLEVSQSSNGSPAKQSLSGPKIQEIFDFPEQL